MKKLVDVRIYLKIVLIFIVASVITSCSTKSRVGGMLNLDTDLTLEFIIAENINPNESGRPSPLYIRLYQLDDTIEFEKSDFIDLYEKDQTLLGSSLINRQDLTPFIPGEDRKERFVLKPGTRFIGLYAEFSQYPQSLYKIIFPITENNVIRNKEKILINGNRMTLDKK
ncbi:MAG: type VI secretion system lipoprotein TssJ [Cellvibrio sp.]